MGTKVQKSVKTEPGRLNSKKVNQAAEPKTKHGSMEKLESFKGKKQLAESPTQLPKTQYDLFRRIASLTDEELTRPNKWGAELSSRIATSIVTFLVANKLVDLEN